MDLFACISLGFQYVIDLTHLTEIRQNAEQIKPNHNKKYTKDVREMHAKKEN